MRSDSGVTTAQILDVFTEEIAARGGRLTGTYHADRRLFVRATVPGVQDVRPGDALQGGVALKATGEAACLYPYLFRLVCQNGAIMAQALFARSLENLHQQAPEEALQSVREGVAACCSREVFLDSMRRARAAAEAGADVLLRMLLSSVGLWSGASPSLLSHVMDEFFRGKDRTLFGLANAVTSVARETEDPDVRWDLEESGGAILLGGVPGRPAGGPAPTTRRMRQPVLVG
jgi:hypothetical protein